MKTKNHIRRVVFAFMQIGFACALVFSIFSVTVHELIGHEFLYAHGEVCSDESEKDACHRFIYHHEESDTCNGSHQHINAKTDECFACTYFKERVHGCTAEPASSPRAFSTENNHSFFLHTNGLFTYHRTIFLRGPPAHV